jgi:hypothetical protein
MNTQEVEDICWRVFDELQVGGEFGRGSARSGFTISGQLGGGSKGLTNLSFSAVVDFITFLHVFPDGRYSLENILASDIAPPAVDVSVTLGGFVKGYSKPKSAMVNKTAGRGPVTITQHPSPSNSYETIIKIDDADPPSTDFYAFTVTWSK